VFGPGRAGEQARTGQSAARSFVRTGAINAFSHSAMAKRARPSDRVVIQFRDTAGSLCGEQLQVDTALSAQALDDLLKSLDLAEVDAQEKYAFFIDERYEVGESLGSAIASLGDEDAQSGEVVIPVTFRPQALFRVRAVTRCSSTLPGHTDSILSVSFAPHGKLLASGSGDHTIRIWDVDTEMPKWTLKGHKDWILALAWSPDGKRLASGSKDSQIRIWNPEDGTQIPKKPLRGHLKWITALDWQPIHENPNCDRLVSASKDGTIKIWDTVFGNPIITLSGHASCVTQVKWGASGLIYSSSEDRTIKVWQAESGKLVRTLEGHGHWVNSIALSTEYVLRTGAFKQNGSLPDGDFQENAKKKVQQALSATGGKELLLSSSDDLTCFLWEPESSKKPIVRLTGHQRPINVAKFSPDSLTIATASFDNSVKLWKSNGEFLATLRSHVQAVYQLAFSSDSRLLVTGSRDSTLKVWDVKAKPAAVMKPMADLPGHADEIYAVDWSPDGIRVASGGKDRVIKFWRR
jgi:ribosome assembly protein 4